MNARVRNIIAIIAPNASLLLVLLVRVVGVLRPLVRRVIGVIALVVPVPPAVDGVHHRVHQVRVRGVVAASTVMIVARLSTLVNRLI